MDTFYIVTAINRLTGLRERVSSKLSLEVAKKKKKMLMGGGKPYYYPRLEPYTKDLFR